MSTPSSPETRAISVDYLARVEGEGSLKVRVRDGQVEIVEFGIFEPPSRMPPTSPPVSAAFALSPTR
jgi:hypothetical protein